MFGGGGHGPDSTPTKVALSEIGASLAKLCWTSSISLGVICLFIFSAHRGLNWTYSAAIMLDRFWTACLSPSGAKPRSERLLRLKDEFGSILFCPPFIVTTARVSGLQRGGSYIGTLVLAELPFGESYTGTFVAKSKRPLTKSRRNAGAMASSQGVDYQLPTRGRCCGSGHDLPAAFPKHACHGVRC